MDLALIRSQTVFACQNVFHRGRIYSSFQGQLFMLEPWPKLRAWAYSLDRARFERIEPPVRIGSSLRVGDGEHDRLPNYYDEDTKTFTFEYRRIRMSGGPQDVEDSEKCHQFVEAIPLPILNRATRFEKSQWRIIYLCTHVPGFVELIDENAALAFALACADYFRDGIIPRLSTIRRVAKLPHSKIASWLDFPIAEIAVEVLAKILPSACDTKQLARIRSLLRGMGLTFQKMVLFDELVMTLVADRDYLQLFSEEFLIEFSGLAKAQRQFIFPWLVAAKERRLRGPGPCPALKSLSSLNGCALEIAARAMLGGYDFIRETWGHEFEGNFNWLALNLRELPATLLEVAITEVVDADDIEYMGAEHYRAFRICGPDATTLLVCGNRIQIDGGLTRLGKSLRNSLIAWLQEALQKLVILGLIKLPLDFNESEFPN